MWYMSYPAVGLTAYRMCSRKWLWILRTASYGLGTGSVRLLLFFFFQAEDGIRDLTVTGVQTCALPISSGTMAPYGATLSAPLVLSPCAYLVNIDHLHHKAVFLMLDGADQSAWSFSVLLRDRKSVV